MASGEVQGVMVFTVWARAARAAGGQAAMHDAGRHRAAQRGELRLTTVESDGNLKLYKRRVRLYARAVPRGCMMGGSGRAWGRQPPPTAGARRRDTDS